MKLPNFTDFKVQLKQQSDSVTESSPTHQPQSPLWNLKRGDCLIPRPAGFLLQVSPSGCTDRSVASTSDGRAGRSRRPPERMVPFTHGPQHKRTRVRLAGPVQTLLQLAGPIREKQRTRRSVAGGLLTRCMV